MANFAYLVGSKSAKQCFAIDPAWDIEAITDAAAADDMKITGALVSHFHPDHCGGHLWGHDIAGVAELIAAQPMPIYAHTDEVAGILHVTGLSKSDVKPCRAGDKLTIGGVEVTLLHTPGHTPGSQCFLCEGALVSGDTLFLSGCGRTDLPGGNADQLYDSLTNTLGKLPASTVLYPGHHYDPAESAPLATVRQSNPYLQAGSLSEWKRLFGT